MEKIDSCKVYGKAEEDGWDQPPFPANTVPPLHPARNPHSS